MHTLYTLVRFFPYWAFPAALVIAEVGVFYKRRQNKKLSSACFALAGLLGVLGLLWLIFRGDKHSDRWVGLFLS